MLDEKMLNVYRDESNLNFWDRGNTPFYQGIKKDSERIEAKKKRIKELQLKIYGAEQLKKHEEWDAK